MSKEIISLGFDPAKITGWACVGKKGNEIEIIGTGKIVLEEKEIYKRLLRFEKEIREIISIMKPWLISCEQLNYARNLNTIRSLSYYQAIIILEAGKKELPCNFIGALEVRKAIGLKGSVDKKEVAEYLRKQFKNDSEVDWGDNNVTDALAVAMAAVIGKFNTKKINERIKGKENEK